ncbi:MAG TPA: sigma factor [Isosphaeraceae bacterium]|nr:sigma factor [Isosphaeraceae bacterium]
MPGEESLNENLSDINTHWPLVDQAKQQGPGSREAQEWVLFRYERAVRRYLSAILPDEDAVCEIYQEYAKLLAEGSFAKVEPAKGKFRFYLKRTLSNLVNDFWRRRRRTRHVPLDSGFIEPEAPSDPEPFDDRDFTAACRRELQEHAWIRLKQHERQTGKPFYTLLRHKVLHRDCRSYQMAEQFSSLLGQSASANKVRKLLHQARALYSELLLNGVVATISDPSVEALEEELIDLDLKKYCGAAFDAWKQSKSVMASGGR